MSSPGKDGTRLCLDIRSQESLACLAAIAYGANTELFVDATLLGGRRLGQRFDPAGLRYSLWVPTDPPPVTPPSRLQILGIFLARELKARGLVDVAEANRLQRAWNAVV